MSFDFELSSCSSSDEGGSVVDISSLLKAGNGENRNLSSTPDHPSDPSNNLHKPSDHDNRSDVDRIGTTATKQSSEISNEGANDGSTKKCPDDQIRFLWGESVRKWQAKRSKSHVSNTAIGKSASDGGTIPMDVDENNVEQKARSPKYVVVQERLNQKGTSRKINFEKCYLNVQSGSGGKKAMVDIIEMSSTSDNPESDNDKNNPTIYTTKKCKDQFFHPENTSSSVSPAFVDCIAIWDPEKQAYVLEVPELIASDITMMPSSGDGTGASNLTPNSNTNVANNDVDENLARNQPRDPLKQQREAEEKLHKQRRRRRS